MDKITLKLFDSAKSKSTFQSIKRNCPKDLKSIIFSASCGISKEKVKESIDWLNQLNDEKKFYFIVYVMDNSNLFGYTSEGVLVNIPIFKQFLSSPTNERLVEAFKYMSNNVQPKDPELFPEFVFDLTDYGFADGVRHRLIHYGFKVGDVIKTPRNKDRWVIEKIDDHEWEEGIKTNFFSASTGWVSLKNEQTGEIFDVGIAYLSQDCKKVNRKSNSI